MFTKLLARLALALALVFPAAVIALAQDEEEEAPPQEQAQPQKEQTPEQKAQAYEKAVKDLTKLEGAFTLYRRKKEILLELKEDDLGKLWFLQATLGTGVMPMTMQAGDPLGAEAIDVFTWERHEEALWLVRPNLRFRWDSKTPLAVASERSFQKAILGSFTVEQTHPAKKLLLVNVTNLFMGDVFRLTEVVNAGGGGYAPDRAKCYPLKVKSFKDNAIVQMQLHYWAAREPQPNQLAQLLGIAPEPMLEDARSLPLRVSYNLWYRKSDGYMPRLFDPRVGYFTTDFFDVAKFSDPDRDRKYIDRFPLKKKDPTAKLSEPVKPIVWTLDPSIPPEYRQACREGILWWNKAFEAIGYKNAVQVQDAPNDPDYDHADGRYNVLRWAISPDLAGAYAIAQFRTDPFTGQILNAAVTVDANYLAAAFAERQSWVIPASDRSALALKAVAGEFDRPAAALWQDDRQNLQDGALRLLGKFGWRRLRCDFANGLSRSAALAWQMAAAAPGGMKVPREEYAKQLMRATVCHEVGHCLGLRHNFTGSTLLSMAQLGDDAIVAKESDSASIMDYVPVNVQAALRGKGIFFSPCIGVYDTWAILYGYGDVKAETPVGELYALSRIASRSGERGHAYMTDENADGWDPYVVRFDESSNPLDYLAKVFEGVRRIKRYAVEKLPRPGESYEKRTQMILSSTLSQFEQAKMATAFVGGMRAARSFKGDVGERPTLAPIDPKLQRQAMALIVSNCLSVNSLGVPESVMSSLSLDPDDESQAKWTAPVRKLISTRQSLLFSVLMAADLTDRIAENQFKTGKNAYTVQEHFERLLGAVFGEVGTGRAIPPIRRDLQQFAVAALTTQAGAAPTAVNGDVRAAASQWLQRLSNRISVQLRQPKSLDPATLAHLRELRETIGRFLARRVTATR